MLFTGLIKAVKSIRSMNEISTGPKTVKQYGDHYIAGLGRDNSHYQQFAANHAKEIEDEFNQRLTINK